MAKNPFSKMLFLYFTLSIYNSESKKRKNRWEQKTRERERERGGND